MAADEFSDYPDTGAEGSSEYLHPQDESIWFTNKKNHDEYEPPRPDADYGVGASGAVSVAARQGSGGGSAAPFIHPFKLEKVTDPEDPNSTKVRVYAGDVFAKIDTFQLGIVTVTTSVESYHATNNHASVNTGDESAHTHGLSLATPGGSDGIHSHTSEGAHGGHSGSDDGTHNHTNSGGHAHDLSNNTATGAPSSSHNHRAPLLVSTTQAHKFVVITGQARPNPLTPITTNWAATFNKAVIADDGTNTLFKYHESANSNGEFYVKWVITIDDDAEVQTVVGSIERVAVGAGRPADDPFGALTQDGATAELSRGQLTGTFYQKIGVVNNDTIEQDQFSNINWSMTVLPEVS